MLRHLGGRVVLVGSDDVALTAEIPYVALKVAEWKRSTDK